MILAMFTVKKIIARGGELWTYGGFGASVRCLLPYVDKLMLVGHDSSSEPGPGHYRIDDPKIEFIGLPETHSELDVLRALPAMHTIANEVVRRADVVQARMPDYTGIIGAAAADAALVPCFRLVIADWGLQARTTSWTKKGGLGAALAAHFWVYDQFERRSCRGQLVLAQGQSCFEKHAPHADAHLITSSAHSRSDVVAPTPRFKGDEWQLLSVGRLEAIKNQRLILEALGLLVQRGENASLSLVGEGPRREELERMARDTGLSARVRFVGQVRPGPDLLAHYDQSDAFCLTSLSEGTPKVVLEAMARGIPVVSSDVGGVPTLIQHEKNGLLFESGDASALANSLQRIRSDERLREAIVRASNRTATENSVEDQTEFMMERVFERWPHLRRAAGTAREIVEATAR